MSKWQNWSVGRILNTLNPQHSSQSQLTDSQRLMYKKEKTENFRAVAQLFLSQCTSSVELTQNDLVDFEVQNEIEDIGQFTELAHGKVNPRFVWNNLDRFMGLSGGGAGVGVDGGYPLAEYRALKGSELVAAFYGKVEKLQGYIAYRPQLKQLIVAFSGTSSFAQTRHNLKAYMIRYDNDQTDRKGKGKDSDDTPKAHAGFLQFYEGIRDVAFKELAKALVSKPVDELVLTGHSLGGAMAYLLALDIMTNSTPSNDSNQTGNSSANVSIPNSTPMKVVVFGCPRIGNAELAEYWRNTADKRGPLLKEYSVRGYNDGATAIPPMNIGYRHFSRTPFYLYQGLLYKIPPSQSEFTAFTVKYPNGDPNPGSNTTPALARKPFLEHPLGGHNYYNRRDMERVLRLMGWFKPDQLSASKEVDWNAYKEWLKTA